MIQYSNKVSDKNLQVPITFLPIHRVTINIGGDHKFIHSINYPSNYLNLSLNIETHLSPAFLSKSSFSHLVPEQEFCLTYHEQNPNPQFSKFQHTKRDNARSNIQSSVNKNTTLFLQFDIHSLAYVMCSGSDDIYFLIS